MIQGNPGTLARPPVLVLSLPVVTEDRPHTDMHAGSDHRAEKLALICQTPLAPRAMFAQGEDVLACKYDQSLLLAGALQFDGQGIPRTLGQAEVVNLKPIILPSPIRVGTASVVSMVTRQKWFHQSRGWT